jgi:hypothetical protein
LWLVLQTRNTMLIWLLGGIWIFRRQWGVLLKVGTAAAGILLMAYFVFPGFFAEQFKQFDALLFEATTEGGVRSTTSDIIMAEVARNFYIGMGALSLQWQNGFGQVYSSYFYLSDVGLLGVYYRFGFLTPFIALGFYWGYWRIMRQCRRKGDLLNGLQLDFTLNAINFFLSTSIMYGGDLSGLAIAAFVYYARASVQTERTVIRPRSLQRTYARPMHQGE